MGTNLLVGLLNAFNLAMGLYALDGNLTLARVVHIFQSDPRHGVPIPMPYDGVPIVLGVIPLVFSAALFLLPLGRALLQPLRTKKVAHENGRLGALREILARVGAGRRPTEAALKQAWTKAAGTEPSSQELTRVVVDLGGDVDIQENGEVRYRFVDLETEAAALEAERAAAEENEARVGRTVFGSDR
jgi:hypothetical protein